MPVRAVIPAPPRAGVGVLAAWLVAATALGQEAPPGAEEWLALSAYSTDRSRAAFAACDRDGNDQLDVFEAAHSLERVRGIRDTAAFRSLDGDADGALTWPEFDRLYRECADAGSALRLRPARPLALAAAGPEAPDQRGAQVVIRVLDRDGDGALTMVELEAMLRDMAVPPALVTQLAGLDLDRSGELSSDEVAALAPLFPQLPAPVAEAPPLPEALVAVDANADAVLDRAELAEALRRLDPTLLRWADLVLGDADASGNRSLGPVELRRADPAIEGDG